MAGDTNPFGKTLKTKLDFLRVNIWYKEDWTRPAGCCDPQIRGYQKFQNGLVINPSLSSQISLKNNLVFFQSISETVPEKKNKVFDV